ASSVRMSRLFMAWASCLQSILPSPPRLGNALKNKVLHGTAESVLVDGLLEALAGGESRNGLGVDLDLLAVRRAAAGARLARARQESAEADHGDALTLGHVVDE